MGDDSNKISHAGHRQRMKERFLKDGNFNSFSDVNILETALFYSIPMKDTNPIAHALLDRFGTLECVFNASYESLLSSVDIRLVDHIIISGKEHFSLASNPRFADCFLIGYDDIRFSENGNVYITDPLDINNT